MRRKRALAGVAILSLVALVAVLIIQRACYRARINALMGQTPGAVVNKLGKPVTEYGPKDFLAARNGLAGEGWINLDRYPRPSGAVWVYKDSKFRFSDRHLFVYFDKRNRVERVYTAWW
ncbi:MAG: hypothetical protein M1133_11440 [Armatimonadetes bacterium]|nr:hypothetical protein [Armatimonadota bacterium]